MEGGRWWVRERKADLLIVSCNKVGSQETLHTFSITGKCNLSVLCICIGVTNIRIKITIKNGSTLSQLDKEHLWKPTVNIILDGEQIDAFPLRSE